MNSILDPRRRNYISPTRVVWSRGLDEAAIARLLAGGSGQCTVFGSAGIRLSAGVVVVLDFGAELAGGIRIISGNTPEKQPAEVRVCFGESVSEALGRPDNTHAIHDARVPLPWYGAAEFGNTGVRVVRIEVPPETAWVELQDVRAVQLCRPLPWLGSFQCSDERLNRIWAAGARTVWLNMQEYLWDGPKRDRLVWMGDLYPELMAIAAVFGKTDLVPRSMDLVRDDTPLPRWMNTISSYSLWWILAQWQWFQLYGDRDYLAEQRDYLVALVRQLDTFVSEAGISSLPNAMLDHPTSRNPAAVAAGNHALLLLAFLAAGNIARAIKDPELAARCLTVAGRLRQVSPNPGRSKPAACLLALAGLMQPGACNRKILSRNPLADFSPFFGYFILQARARAGDTGGCLQAIRDLWGGMLDLGATTFWEHFDFGWIKNASRIDEMPVQGKCDIHRECGEFCYTGLRNSLCHGWSAGPTAWLTEHVLGIRPMLPGCRTLLVQPDLGDLTFAEGTFPTPWGTVRVAHRRLGTGQIRSSIVAPPEVRIVRKSNLTNVIGL